MWMVYMLRLSNNALYTGITNDIARRTAAHTAGTGSKYVRAHLPFTVVYIHPTADRSESSIIEAQIKKMTRKNKDVLLNIAPTERILLFCNGCGVVISLSRDDYPEDDFEVPCVICRNIVHHHKDE